MLWLIWINYNLDAKLDIIFVNVVFVCFVQRIKVPKIILYFKVAWNWNNLIFSARWAELWIRALYVKIIICGMVVFNLAVNFSHVLLETFWDVMETGLCNSFLSLEHYVNQASTRCWIQYNNKHRKTTWHFDMI